MITIDGKQIKLQIWDTVSLDNELYLHSVTVLMTKKKTCIIFL